MTALKTLPNDASVEDFIEAVDDESKRVDSYKLLHIFAGATGDKPKLWGASIIGYGQYHYKSDRSSQEGDWPLVGFSPRKQKFTVYITPGFDNYQDLLEGQGKFKTSSGCLYFNKLADVDEVKLAALISKAYDDMKQLHSSGQA